MLTGINHIALNAPDEEIFQELRRRLVDAGASDGMDCEIAVWKEAGARAARGTGHPGPHS